MATVRSAASGAATEFRAIPLHRLSFDPQNPRLPKTIDGSEESQVIGWMVEDASLLDLMESIAAQGYFYGEPLLVVEQKSGKYIVVEGNRRLAAARLLNDPTLATTRRLGVARVAEGAAQAPPKSLPSVVFKNRRDILQYLGYRHITGVKAWEPLAKARYVKQLFRDTKGGSIEERYRKLAVTIGSGKRADYVARLLTALALYEKLEDSGFFGIDGLSEETVKFSFFLVALNHSGISSFLGIRPQDPTLQGLNHRHLREFSDWAFRPLEEGGATVLGESRRMRDLASVVASRPALSALRKGESLRVAMTLAGAPDDTFAAEVQAAYDRMGAAQQQIKTVRHVTATTLSQLVAITKRGDLLARAARKKQDNEE